jgi:hypothetical protein
LPRWSQHDVQLDYYGKQLASAGSDRRIKIFDVVDGMQRQQTAELSGHDGPIWQLAWAHPEFGNILASCSYDRQVGCTPAYRALRSITPPRPLLLNCRAVILAHPLPTSTPPPPPSHNCP